MILSITPREMAVLRAALKDYRDLLHLSEEQRKIAMRLLKDKIFVKEPNE